MFVRNEFISIVAVMFLAFGCTSNGLAPSGQLRQPAPDFSLPTLDGRQIVLSQLKGKVVLLDFWATWCPSCREGLAHLQSLAANTDMAQRDLVALAVNKEEKPATIRAFIDREHYAFTTVLDADGSVGRDYMVSTLPTTIVVGRDGLVQAVINGWSQDTTHQIDEAVARALDAPIR